MQGHTATSRCATGRPARATSPAASPPNSAAANGWSSGLPPRRATDRRRHAPARPTAATTARSGTSGAPKITDSAAAPAAAMSAKRASGTGGARPTAPSRSSAASGGMVPRTRLSITASAAATRLMSTPAGSTSTNAGIAAVGRVERDLPPARPQPGRPAQRGRQALHGQPGAFGGLPVGEQEGVAAPAATLPRRPGANAQGSGTAWPGSRRCRRIRPLRPRVRSSPSAR